MCRGPNIHSCLDLQENLKMILIIIIIIHFIWWRISGHPRTPYKDKIIHKQIKTTGQDRDTYDVLMSTIESRPL